EQGDAVSARSFYERSLVIFRELGDRWGIAGSLGDLGNLEREQGDFAGAHRLHRESLQVFQELDHKRGIARLLDCFASSAAAQSHPERALCLAGAAAALRETPRAPPPPAGPAPHREGLRPPHPGRPLCGAGAPAALREPLGAALTPAEQVRHGKSLEPARQALTNAAAPA